MLGTSLIFKSNTPASRLAGALVAAACLASVGARADSVGGDAVRPVAGVSATILLAQNFAPPAPVPSSEVPADLGAPSSGDSASLLVRIDRLEDQVRALNGQIEQLQFDNRKLQDALQKFQQDVDFRFQDAARGKTPAHSAPAPTKKSDAFDPSAAPTAPGAPRSLGGGALADAPAQSDRTVASGEPLQLGAGPAAAPPSPSAPSSATAGGSDGIDAIIGAQTKDDPRIDYDLALVSFNNGQFDRASAGFQSYLAKHPKDRAAPDAIYYLGESYWRLGQIKDAARQYLKLSTDYSKSPHAPDALLKLGLALDKLGAREQACASFAQVESKYPNAPAAVRAAVEKGMKSDQC